MKIDKYLKVLLSLLSMTFLIYIGVTLFKNLRYDFTEEKLYTLSHGTKSILSKLDSRIRLKLYYSKTAANKGSEGLRSFNNYFRYVQDLLEQYVDNSRNNLVLEIIDPRPDTPEEEDALAYGLKKFHLSESEKYFFGLVAENESGTEKIIEFFDPNQKDKLEYNITTLIHTVLNPKKKTIGILSSVDVINEEISPYLAQIMRIQGKAIKESWGITKLLSQFYNVKKIEEDTFDTSGLDSLIVIHPKGFSEKTLFTIDQYLMRGGKLLVFLDPHFVNDPSLRGQSVSSSPDVKFKKLMDKWGLELKNSTFAGDKYLSGVGKYSPNLPPQRLLPLVNCNAKCVDIHKDNITTGLNNSLFVFPGSLQFKEGIDIQAMPIISTTDKGGEYKAQGYELNQPQLLWNKFKEGNQPVIMGYKLVGKFESAFPNGIKDSEDSKKESKEIIKKAKKESAVIVFSDIDFITDQFAFKNTFLGMAVANDNSSIFLNSVEALTGNVELMSVRSKGRVDRSFDVVNKIELDARKKTEGKVKEINANISKFQTELNSLTRQANKQNIALIQNESIKKRKELVKEIALLKKELRDVKREGREKVETLGKVLQYLNTLLIPSVLIVVGIYYSRKRYNLTKSGFKTNFNKEDDERRKINKLEMEVNL